MAVDLTLTEAAKREVSHVTCEAAIQGRNTIYFHRCSNRAKAEAESYMREPMKVCGLHARFSGSLIKSK